MNRKASVETPGQSPISCLSSGSQGRRTIRCAAGGSRLRYWRSDRGLFDFARFPNSASASSNSRWRRCFGRGEYASQVFLGFADILADHRDQIDLVEIQMELLANASAAMVLPVPLPPANNAPIPRPREFSAKPHCSYTVTGASRGPRSGAQSSSAVRVEQGRPILLWVPAGAPGPPNANHGHAAAHPRDLAGLAAGKGLALQMLTHREDRLRAQTKLRSDTVQRSVHLDCGGA